MVNMFQSFCGGVKRWEGLKYNASFRAEGISEREQRFFTTIKTSEPSDFNYHPS